jgi:uncharacterized Fe-S radical SAM superfamily protein PflX
VSGKTDVYRRGNNVVIAKTNGKACPVSWLLRYIFLAELRYDSEDFIFRAIRYFKSKNVYKLINVNRSLSYTRAPHVFQITMIFPVHVNTCIKYIWSNRIFLYNWFAQSTFSAFQKHRNKFIITRVRL